MNQSQIGTALASAISRQFNIAISTLEVCHETNTTYLHLFVVASECQPAEEPSSSRGQVVVNVETEPFDTRSWRQD